MDISNTESQESVCTDGAVLRQTGSESRGRLPGVDNQPTPEKDNLTRRLRTFANWTGKIRAVTLAIAGFVLIGPGDKVECDTCKVKLYNWTEKDVPLDAHRKHSPDCSFLNKWFPVVTPKIRSGYDLAKAKYSSFADQVKRLGTFEAWPLKLDIHSPQNMAAAGFFYIGSADRARCFYCGVTLRDWDTGDDPFDAHLQWSPRCEYIQHTHNSKQGNEIDMREQDPGHAGASCAPGVVVANLGSSRDKDGPGTGCPTKNQGHAGSPPSKPRNSPQVEAVLAMGVSEELIRQAIASRKQNRGEDFPDATSLFLAVEDLM
ncbi:baculoviral IAP repeat-containing protein 2-like [Haliotis rufescens]|uniref:baculoviral IAP repeat-containing protein 2-like n=1 Tax=Haliotis rufescens TaxID=6454 RepID=UPI001EAFE37C|nr:baculoviral IAP repeat-containing protein 2-like [Haliotis rufescens]